MTKPSNDQPKSQGKNRGQSEVSKTNRSGGSSKGFGRGQPQRSDDLKVTEKSAPITLRSGNPSESSPISSSGKSSFSGTFSVVLQPIETREVPFSRVRPTSVIIKGINIYIGGIDNSSTDFVVKSLLQSKINRIVEKYLFEFKTGNPISLNLIKQFYNVQVHIAYVRCCIESYNILRGYAKTMYNEFGTRTWFSKYDVPLTNLDRFDSLVKDFPISKGIIELLSISFRHKGYFINKSPIVVINDPTLNFMDPDPEIFDDQVGCNLFYKMFSSDGRGARRALENEISRVSEILSKFYEIVPGKFISIFREHFGLNNLDLINLDSSSDSSTSELFGVNYSQMVINSNNYFYQSNFVTSFESNLIVPFSKDIHLDGSLLANVSLPTDMSIGQSGGFPDMEQMEIKFLGGVVTGSERDFKYISTKAELINFSTDDYKYFNINCYYTKGNFEINDYKSDSWYALEARPNYDRIGIDFGLILYGLF